MPIMPPTRVISHRRLPVIANARASRSTLGRPLAFLSRGAPASSPHASGVRIVQLVSRTRDREQAVDSLRGTRVPLPASKRAGDFYKAKGGANAPPLAQLNSDLQESNYDLRRV